MVATVREYAMAKPGLSDANPAARAEGGRPRAASPDELARILAAHRLYIETERRQAGLDGANLLGVRVLDGASLTSARDWRTAARQPDLACGAAMPPARDGP
jgi:hypothetical protein